MVSIKKNQLGRHRRGYENNIKKNIQEMGWGVDCIDLAQNWGRWTALLNAVIKLSTKCEEFLD